jgi:hypothetical protein
MTYVDRHPHEKEPIMKSIKTTTTFCVLLAGSACSGGHSDVESGYLETDDGLYAVDIDLPSAETEGEPDPVALPTGSCIQYPQPYVFGYVHQCAGKITVSYVAQWSGETYEAQDALNFGPGQSNPDYWLEPDSYDNPLVQACCGPFDYQDATTEQKLPYVNSCLFDAVQQICHALPHLLRKQAEESEGLSLKVALNSLAGKVEEKEDECFAALWGNGAPGPNGDAINQLDGTTWSPTNKVTFEIEQTEILNWTQEGDVTWRTCNGMFDNDDAVIPTAPFDVPNTGGVTTYILAPGTTMTGSGPLSSSGTITPSTAASSLTLAHTSAMDLEVTGLTLRSEVARVSVGAQVFELDRAAVILRNVIAPSVSGGEYSVPAGAAHFVATAAFEGDTRVVDMSNDDPIVFRYASSTASWEFDPFDLSYVEPGFGVWTLSFDGLSFLVRG